MEDNIYSKKIFLILLFFAIIVLGILCKVLHAVVLPMLVAILIAFVLKPVVQNLNKKFKIPWSISSIIVILLFLILIAGLSSILIKSLKTVVEKYPVYESKFLSMYSIFADAFNLEYDNTQSLFENLWSNLNVRSFVQETAVFLSSGIFTFGKSFFMFLIMLILFLTEMRLFNKKISFAYIGQSKTKMLRISAKIIDQTVRFVSIKFYISLITGLLVGIITAVTGLSFPILWGFLAFIMNFIPIFGSIFSVGLTSAFAFMEFYPFVGKAVFLMIVMTAINTSLGNIIEPKIEGKHLGLSPFVILVSLTLFGWIWGFIGMLLAVPLTVIIRICCENISYLHPVAIFLGGDPAETKKNIEV